MKESTMLVVRLLKALKKSAEAGLHNTTESPPGEFNVDDFEEQIDVFRTAVVNLQRLYSGSVDDVNFGKIKKILESETYEKTLEEQIKVMLDYGYTVILQDFTEEERKEKKQWLHNAYHPSDELLDELVELFNKYEE